MVGLARGRAGASGRSGGSTDSNVGVVTAVHDSAGKAAGLEVELIRDRGGHSVFSVDGTQFSVHHHVEIGEGLAEAIFDETQPALGKGWWR